jgi:hypothetical protein
VFTNLKSTLVQIAYNEAREECDKQKILALLDEETALAKQHYALASTDCKIGYEASNHYYYTQNSFLEKLINLEFIKEYFAQN